MNGHHGGPRSAFKTLSTPYVRNPRSRPVYDNRPEKDAVLGVVGTILSIFFELAYDKVLPEQ